MGPHLREALSLDTYAWACIFIYFKGVSDLFIWEGNTQAITNDVLFSSLNSSHNYDY